MFALWKAILSRLAVLNKQAHVQSVSPQTYCILHVVEPRDDLHACSTGGASDEGTQSIKSAR